jgi:hypothetical protein
MYRLVYKQDRTIDQMAERDSHIYLDTVSLFLASLHEPFMDAKCWLNGKSDLPTQRAGFVSRIGYEHLEKSI